MQTTTQATSRQTWAIFCITGHDVRACGLSLEDAGAIITLAKGDKAAAIAKVASLPNSVLKRKTTAKADFRSLYDEADKAGRAAAEGYIPTPMVVQQHANMADGNSAVVKQWVVPNGVCGFAWVTIRPGNSGFAKFLAKEYGARPGYGGGIQLWVHQYGQSMERKEAYAAAFANTVAAKEIRAQAGSRMD